MLRFVELTDNRNGVFSSDKNIKFIEFSDAYILTKGTISHGGSRRVARNFLGQGSFLKTRAKILIFFLRLNYMLTLQWDSFQGVQFDCDCGYF